MCIVALIVFGILGIFSAKFRPLAWEAFKCAFRTVTLRSCETGFDQRIKAKLMAGLVKTNAPLARFFHRHFNKISRALSFIFVIAFLGSMVYSGIVVFNLVRHGTCTPSSPDQCIFTPKEKCETKQNAQDITNKIIGQVGTFYEVSEPLCERSDKPLVLMFSTSWCPHCQWAKPIFEKAVKDYIKKGEIIARQWELDTNDNTLTTAKETTIDPEDMALYEKYNPEGTIPTFVFGCKYFRVGTGHESIQDKAAEEKEFKELIDQLLED